MNFNPVKIFTLLTALVILGMAFYLFVSPAITTSNFKSGYTELKKIGFQSGFDVDTLEREDGSNLEKLKFELILFKQSLGKSNSKEAKTLESLVEIFETKIEFYNAYDKAKNQSRRIALSSNPCQELHLAEQESKATEELLEAYKNVLSKMNSFQKEAKNIPGMKVRETNVDLSQIEEYYLEQLNSTKELEGLCET